jgi:hypothetical protein
MERKEISREVIRQLYQIFTTKQSILDQLNEIYFVDEEKFGDWDFLETAKVQIFRQYNLLKSDYFRNQQTAEILRQTNILVTKLSLKIFISENLMEKI